MEKTKIRVVLPEGNDDRVRLALRVLLDSHPNIHPIVIGSVEEIKAETGETGKYTVLDASDDVLMQAADLINQGEADAIVAGAVHSTGQIIRSYLKNIGLSEGISRATSCFLMEKGTQRYIFADCAVNIDPGPEILAETAFLCHQFAPLVGIDPKIAFISFSTKGSAKGPAVEKVQMATKITAEKYPQLVLDGELQIDSAIVPAVTQRKAPDSPLGGQATVLIFPDLDAGNVAYKIAQRLGGFKATGPLLLGFSKPVHDLSRGCSVDDIVSAVEVASKQVAVAHETS